MEEVVERPFPLLRAMNLVTSKPASDMALAAPGRDGRMLTLVPWRGRALVGTSQSTQLVEPGALSIGAAEIEAFISDANVAFPALKLSADDVTLVHRGVVPAVLRHGRPDLKPSPEIIDHGNGAVTVVGVKFTSARGVAAAGDPSRRTEPWPSPFSVAHSDHAAAWRSDCGSRSAGDRNRTSAPHGHPATGDPSSDQAVCRRRG